MAADTAMRSDNLKNADGHVLRPMLELVSDPDAGRAPEAPLRVVHRALRGRYRLAAILAAAHAVIGGAVGYHAVAPKYVSTGLVHIEGALPAVLYPTQENQVSPTFEAYVTQQTAFLQSGTLLAQALKRAEMAGAGWPAGPEGVSALQDAMTVERGRNESTISVSVAHREAEAARTAVNAVLAAYRTSAPDPDGIPLAAKERLLSKRELRLDGQLEDLRLRMLEASGQYGREAVDRMHAARVDDLMAIEEKLEQVRRARRAAESGDAAAAVPVADDGEPLSPLEEQELALEAEIRTRTQPPAHPIMRDLQRKLDAVRAQIALRKRALGGRPAAEPGDALVELDRLEAGYEAQRLELREETAALGLVQVALTGLEDEAGEIKERLATTRRRLDEIRFETGRESRDRVSIVEGALPGLPARDRRAGLAAAGVLFGACGGVGLVALVGILDRRVRFADELAALDLPAAFIDLLPDAGARLDAAVRRLRHRLQVQRRDPDRGIHAIASCGSGEGSADVARALATSFAEAGHRALLVERGDGGGEIHETSVANLWSMPTGLARRGAAELTREAVHRLYEDLRNAFDAVVVDAGPVRTEFEACLLAAEADQVTLLVARNRRRELVAAAMSHLEQVGVRDVGVVLNRACPADVHGLDDADFAPPNRAGWPATGSPDVIGRVVRAEPADADQRKRAA